MNWWWFAIAAVGAVLATVKLVLSERRARRDKLFEIYSEFMVVASPWLEHPFVDGRDAFERFHAAISKVRLVGSDEVAKLVMAFWRVCDSRKGAADVPARLRAYLEVGGAMRADLARLSSFHRSRRADGALLPGFEATAVPPIEATPTSPTP